MIDNILETKASETIFFLQSFFVFYFNMQTTSCFDPREFTDYSA